MLSLIAKMFLICSFVVGLTIAVETNEASNCANDELKCQSYGRRNCVDISYFCDGLWNCRDGLDEPQYATNQDQNVKLCRGTSKIQAALCILPEVLEHDKNRLCREDTKCSKEEFECRDRSFCIQPKIFCDEVKTCTDGSDEPYAIYGDDGNLCRRLTNDLLCILPSELELKRPFLCRDEIYCTKEQFECRDGSRCLPISGFCNGKTECRDGSDERIFVPNVDSGYRSCLGRDSNYFRVGPCQISEEYFCDGNQFCAEGMDECLCGEKNKDHLDNVCFRCFESSGTYIPISRVCDGVFDCLDLSDECLCQSTGRPKICERIVWEGFEPYLQCEETNTSERIDINMTHLCNINLNCNYNENEKHCGDKKEFEVVDCKKNRFGEKTLSVVCEYITDQACINDNKIHCKVLLDNRFTEIGSNSSDRWINCAANYEDFVHCEVEYQCTYVSYQDVLAIKKCRNKVDECSGFVCPVPCNCTYFICNDKVDGNLILHGDAVCDGHKDCLSGIDECQSGCIDSVFSDEKSMIRNKGVLALVWILSVFAIVGCISVVASTLHGILKTRADDNSRHRNVNKLLILSLSVSDIFVGIYTLSICIKAIQVEGNYCSLDIEWRTSTICSILGALLIIGSEQSVLTLVLISIHRLHTVMRPLSTPKIKRIIIAIVISWMISIMLGLIPLIPYFEDHFLSYVSFNDSSIFKTKVNHADKERIINWLIFMNNGTIRDFAGRSREWSTLRELIAKINPSSPITAAHEFGYYSSHTVCLPTLFPGRQDRSWMYTFCLLLFNFLGFVFMLALYIALYRITYNKMNSGSEAARDSNKQSTAMQRKLTRILLSDLVCWMPVCLMGFLQLSGIDIPNDAYLPTGLLVIPINSALNPFLYSDLPDVLSTQKIRFQSWICQRFHSLRNGGSSAETPTVNAYEMDVTEWNMGVDSEMN